MKKLLKKYLPSHGEIRSHRAIKIFGPHLNKPWLWQINRRSVAKAVGIGLFSAYIPIPFEMLLAAILAWGMRAYLPLAVSLVWISNPFTWILLYSPPYWLGTTLLDVPFLPLKDLDLTSFSEQYFALFVGCIPFAICFGFAGYVFSRVMWRMLTVRRIEKRRQLLKDIQTITENQDTGNHDNNRQS